MRDYVIDANVLMSIVISGKSIYKPLLDYYNFIMPEFGLVEIDKYKNLIFDKSKMQPAELITYSYSIFSSVTILPNYVMNDDIVKTAIELVKEIDIKDVSYIALSMQLDLILLTRDKKLFEGTQKRKYRKVMYFDDFLKNI